jgi:predicted TPR repeat methyltransferase
MARQGVKRLVGIDLSQPMLDLAAGQLEGAAHANVDLICADFGEFQTQERFDLVVAMGFFDYQEEPIRQLTKMRSLSKGSVVVSFPSRHLFRTPVRKFRYHFKRCPVYFYDPHEIAGLASEAGFDMVRTIKLPGAGMDYVTILSQTAVTNPQRHFSGSAVSPGVERQSAGIER